MKKIPVWPFFVCVLLALAVFFKFALRGYSYAAYTLTFIAVVIVAYRLVRKHKALTTILTVLIGLGLALFIVLEIPIISSARTDKDAKCDYIIVLGAGVHGSTPSLSLRDRMQAALEYLTEYPDSAAVVSGGQGSGEDMTEAEAMRIWLTERGVSPERIIKEDRATSTEENLVFSLAIIDALDGDPSRVGIVTSEYHLYRAKYMAKQLGVDEPVGVAADTSLPLLKLNYFIREAFGVLYMYVFG